MQNVEWSWGSFWCGIIVMAIVLIPVVAFVEFNNPTLREAGIVRHKGAYYKLVPVTKKWEEVPNGR